MASKYELTISTNYVPDWTYIEAIREIFQNAIDNETVSPENKMEFTYEDGVVRVINKTSVLKIDSLLLGSTTKKDDVNTIGKHGEGYKIAFMVLLREGKSIKVYNYGSREIWEARLVKSKRFNGQLVPTIFVEKEAFWKTAPDSNLTVEISGITEEEYSRITEKNINIQENVQCVKVKNKGRILTDTEQEAGNIYVKGLFICKNDKLKYGYDFAPSALTLDRDRRLVGDFNLQWGTSIMWGAAFANGDLKSELVELVEDNSFDTAYISTLASSDELGELVVNSFISKNGNQATPVTSTEEMEDAIDQGLKPVIVNSNTASLIRATHGSTITVYKKKDIKEKFQALLEKIESRLSDAELAEFESLIDEL